MKFETVYSIAKLAIGGVGVAGIFALVEVVRRGFKKLNYRLGDIEANTRCCYDAESKWMRSTVSDMITAYDAINDDLIEIIKERINGSTNDSEEED